MERLTNQKKIILEYLKGTKIHPSAEKVYSDVKKILPQISLGTVYRILKNLKDKGETQVIPVEGISYFDGDTTSHAHFICRKCHRLFDVLDICRDCQTLRKQKLKVGKFKNYQLYFYGYCKNCFK